MTDKDAIEEEVISFFNALFNGHHGNDLIDKGTLFLPDWSSLDNLLTGLGRISDTEKSDLVGDIQPDEMDFVVKKCPNLKSPGMDGLTYEFYKKVWGIIGSKFVTILQVQLSRCKLVESDTNGATKLLPKVDGIPKVDELRPITLLNADYKLLTKWIVLRLKPLMGTVIRSSQLCNAGDKNILFGAHNILSSMSSTESLELLWCHVTGNVLYLVSAAGAIKYLGFLITYSLQTKLRSLGFGL